MVFCSSRVDISFHTVSLVDDDEEESYEKLI